MALFLLGTMLPTMRRRQAGFTLVEIMLVVGIIGIMTAIATPMFLSYYQGAQLRVAAEEVVTFLNQGRQLAITQNGVICVHISPTAMHYHQGSCAGTTWTGPGTDAAGNIAVPAGITLLTTADPTFNYLGASTGATYTITHTQSSTLVHVVVALSGRVNITP
jgi:type II secretion system protein H